MKNIAWLEVNRVLRKEFSLLLVEARGGDPTKARDSSVDVPAYWLEFFMEIALAGDEGINTKELSERVGMKQSTLSRLTKILSGQPVHNGLGLVVCEKDPEYRYRQRLFLSRKGKKIFAKLSKEGNDSKAHGESCAAREQQVKCFTAVQS